MAHPQPASIVASPSAARPSLAERLLHLPLFYKLLIANFAIVAVGAVAGTSITLWHVLTFPSDPHYELIGFFAVGGLIVSVIVNGLVLRLALAPLDRLQTTVDAVRNGRLDVRADTGPFSDDRFDRLAATLNQMLDRVEQDTRQLHQLSQAIIQAHEDERQRIARELHDEAAQALTLLLVRLRLLERADDPDAARAHVVELRQLTAQTLEDIRRIALELRPTILDDLGLVAALAWRVDEFNAAGSTRATLNVCELKDRLPRAIELACYRVAQEALTNIARHAEATAVQVDLCWQPGWIELRVADDGRGFDSAAIPISRSGGLGLRGMRERLALLGGELAVESSPGQGTRLTARVPLDESDSLITSELTHADDQAAADR
jgi:two-component system, NarL family, sensor histidine kinase UhpB